MEQTELTIETLPVEIKVIRVGGHKMTLAVFDQLPEGDLEDFFDLSQKPFHEVVKSLRWVDNQSSLGVLGYVSTKKCDYLLVAQDGRLIKLPLWTGVMNGIRMPDMYSSFRAAAMHHYSQLFIAT
jgi:hypothetical protein